MQRLLTAAVLSLLAPAAIAQDIVIEAPYARASRPGAPTGAIFMVIQNTGDTADRLVGAASPVAKRVELHTHIEDNGIMRMREIEGGIQVPAGGSHVLQRGGDHVMLMGLTETLEDGMTIEVTLTFEAAGDISTTVPVDNARGQAGHGN